MTTPQPKWLQKNAVMVEKNAALHPGTLVTPIASSSFVLCRKKLGGVLALRSQNVLIFTPSLLGPEGKHTLWPPELFQHNQEHHAIHTHYIVLEMPSMAPLQSEISTCAEVPQSELSTSAEVPDA